MATIKATLERIDTGEWIACLVLDPDITTGCGWTQEEAVLSLEQGITLLRLDYAERNVPMPAEYDDYTLEFEVIVADEDGNTISSVPVTLPTQ